MSLLIDDNDPLVQYNSPGGRGRLGEPPEFDGTTHSSATRGDTAALTFEGTSITVFRTVGGDDQSRLNFFLDGTMTGSFDVPQVSRPTALHNLPHNLPYTLTVTVDNLASTLGPTFFLDYFVYTPTSTTGKTVLIDDNDAGVTYSPQWQERTDSDSSLKRTEHVSEAVGAWASISFEGTGISIIGFPSQQEFKASVAIDGLSPAPITYLAQNNSQLFTSGVLPPGPHILNVTVLDNSALAIGCFLVENGLTDAPVSMGGPTASASLQAAAPIAGAARSKVPTIAAIVGGSAAGLLILALIFGLILRRRSRKAQHTRRDQADTQSVGSGSGPPLWTGKEGPVSARAPRPFQPPSFLDLENAESGGPPPYNVKYLPAAGVRIPG
ncbi:hypothetical protein DFH08DRAFT_1073226 [Mycena albidolilacea]|uniref:Uncharacterized protein n=1 Tax=Mycena albidolilacea TaxID=1033008 RepID=A0AAD7APL1_9AGAR|nr:hypothetical protein DFH08DRAFT_1073226 [Mycena albidolilacea]